MRYEVYHSLLCPYTETAKAICLKNLQIIFWWSKEAKIDQNGIPETGDEFTWKWRHNALAIFVFTAKLGR